MLVLFRVVGNKKSNFRMLFFLISFNCLFASCNARFNQWITNLSQICAEQHLWNHLCLITVNEVKFSDVLNTELLLPSFYVPTWSTVRLCGFPITNKKSHFQKQVFFSSSLCVLTRYSPSYDSQVFSNNCGYD